ncbi:unnamed protein product [Penicillium pancosmium]
MNSNLLGLAAKDDNVDLTLMLLYQGANVNAFFRRRTPVMRALIYSSSAVLKLLLKSSRLDINVQNREHESALWCAVKYGSCSTLRPILELTDCAVDLRHQRGQTALHLAVWWGKIGLAELLLSKGSDPYSPDEIGSSPWAWAARYNRPSMRAVFLKGQDYFHLVQDNFDEPALHQAILHGSVDAVNVLLRQKRPGVATIDSHGATALHLAVHSRRLEVVDLLLQHPHSDVNCVDNAGKTPLWWSMFLSYDEITERLLAVKNIDANLIGGSGRLDTPSAPLHHAATRLDTTILKQLLAAPGIDLNIYAARQTPFSAAAAAGRVSAMRILMSQRGVEINTGGILMNPPLCQAAVGGHLEAVRLLVQQGQRLRINQGTLTTHDTALGIAVRAGDLEIVRTLLRHKRIDPSLENRWLESPLVLAVKGAHVLVVDALLADPMVDTSSLRVARAIATHEGIRRAIQYEMDDRRARCEWIKAHWSLAKWTRVVCVDGC